MFITIDGGDGCGKSTQLERLHRELCRSGREVVICRDPGGTALAEKVRDILLHTDDTSIAPVTETLLFMAARAQLVAEIIRPALDAGKTVLCDRFVLSTLVYQGYAGGVPPDDIRAVARVATGGLEPDLGIVLDISRETALQRMRDRGAAVDRMEAKGDAYHGRVRDGFLALAAAEPERYVVLDGTRPVETIAGEIWTAVAKKFRTETT